MAVSVRALFFSLAVSMLLAFQAGRLASNSLSRLVSQRRALRKDTAGNLSLARRASEPLNGEAAARWIHVREVQCQPTKGGECQVDEEDDHSHDEHEEQDDSDASVEAVSVRFKIQNVPVSRLASQDAFVDLIHGILDEEDLELLSYACPTSLNHNLRYLGILDDKSHVTAYAIPRFEMVLLDFNLEQSVEEAQSLAATVEAAFVPAPGDLHWSVVSRAFSPQNDITRLVLSNDSYQKHVASVQTPFQRIDIYDVIASRDCYRIGLPVSYKRSLANEDTYESRHPAHFEPDRYILLDGVLQSTRYGDSAYHEALVHPAMLAHANPKRAAIIGGGEGATLREVLKHATIEEAIMVEIDELMVNVSREFIPEWPDCSDLVGSADWCGEDPRSRMYYEDALGWFMTRYSDENSKEEKIDLIIMDALDPESEVPFATALYDNDEFVRALHNALSEDGILALQLGESSDPTDAPESISRFKNRVIIRDSLTRVGFQSLHLYDETHAGFGWPWVFLVAFKSYDTRKRWVATEARIDIEIHKRMVRTKSGKIPLRYFDSSTMATYQLPNRALEIVYCREFPTPKECETLAGGFDPNYLHISEEELQVRKPGGLIGEVDIPQGPFYLGLEQAIHPSRVDVEAPKNIWGLHDSPWKTSALGPLLSMIESKVSEDTIVSSVSPGILGFADHECNDTSNLQSLSVDVHRVFSPVMDRHLSYHLGTVALRDINAGEKLIFKTCNDLGSNHGKPIMGTL